MFRLPCAALIALALFAAACSGDDDSNPTAPSEPPGNTVTYTVIGASDGMGVGGSVVCAPLDLGCENGTGYAQTIRRRWVSEGRTVTFRNLSIPGTVLSPAIAEIAIALGRGDPGNMMRAPGFMPGTTTHVTVFAGGNDANVIGASIAAGAGGSDIRGYIDTLVRQWGADLVELIARIRSEAPNARIVAFNLPNLGAAPYMAGRPPLERSMMQRIATGLSDQVNALTTRGVIVVDLLCDPRSVQPSTYSSDGFHPSDAGYALMAELGYAALTTGSAPAPQPSCGGRTVLPVF
jgi:lysophospholipase L1-like esterase